MDWSEVCTYLSDAYQDMMYHVWLSLNQDMMYDYKFDVNGIGDRSLTSLHDTSALYLSAYIFPLYLVITDYLSHISRYENIRLITLDTFL